MTDLKRITSTTLLWLDLEMTGLNAQVDQILEVAAVVTGWDFKTLDTFESGVGGDLDKIRSLMDASDFYTQYPQNKRQLLQLVESSSSLADVELRLLDVIDRHAPPAEPVLLAGNSIHADRQFIRRYWPKLDARLHYRMLDVSAWKVVMAAKYGLEYTKKETHRAVDDVRESIEELEFYLTKIKNS